MRSILSVIFFLCFSSSLIGQTGSLEVKIMNQERLMDSMLLKIIKADTVVCKKNAELPVTFFDSLNEGDYILEMSLGDTLVIDYKYIKIKSDTLNLFSVYLPKISYCIENDSLPDESGNEKTSTFYYSLGKYFDDEIIRRQFVFEYNYTSYLFNGKHFDIGILTGANTEYVFFRKDTTLAPGGEIKREGYNSYNTNIGLQIRLAGYDMQAEDKVGLILDAGVLYRFPMLFEYYYKNNEGTFATKKIHQYKDLTAFCRFGFNIIAFSVEYRLSDYIKGDFPELLKLKYGISIYL